MQRLPITISVEDAGVSGHQGESPNHSSTPIRESSRKNVLLALAATWHYNMAVRIDKVEFDHSTCPIIFRMFRDKGRNICLRYDTRLTMSMRSSDTVLQQYFIWTTSDFQERLDDD